MERVETWGTGGNLGNEGEIKGTRRKEMESQEKGRNQIGAAFIPVFFNTGNTEKEFANTGITGILQEKSHFFLSRQKNFNFNNLKGQKITKKNY